MGSSAVAATSSADRPQRCRRAVPGGCVLNRIAHGYPSHQFLQEGMLDMNDKIDARYQPTQTRRSYSNP